MAEVFLDNFTSFDTTKWFLYTTGFCYGRTIFGRAPEIVSETSPNPTTFIRLRLQNYGGGFCGSPTSYNRLFKGTEFMSNQTFDVNNLPAGNGFDFEARCRVTSLPAGVVAGFFPYIDTGVKPYPQDEIDFEFLGKKAADQIWLNSWNNGVQPSSGQLTTFSGLNRANWNFYKMRWTRNRIDWLLSDQIIKTETNTAYIPDAVDTNGLKIHFNIWVPAGGTDPPGMGSFFPDAFSESLSKSPPDAQASWYWDIDYVRASTITPAMPFLTITSPYSGATYLNLTTISGRVQVASGGTGPITSVQLFIQRLSDSLYWTGSAWGASTPLTTTVTTPSWSRGSGNPSGTDLPAGQYKLTAKAFDSASNSNEVSNLITIS